MFKLIASGNILFSTLAFAIACVLFQMSGLVAEARPSFFQALYSLPVYISSAAIFILLTARLFGSGRSFFERLRLFSLMLMIAGILIGGLTHFEGKVILTEEQLFPGKKDEYNRDSLFIRPLSRFPDIKIMMEKVTPLFKEGGKRMGDLRAEVSVIMVKEKGKINKVLLSSLPTFFDGTWMSLGRFGYSPLVILSDQKGIAIDNVFIPLKLFPHGEEDFFRLLSSHTFYVRYFPGDTGIKGNYTLRIVRNKNLVIKEREIFFGENVDFDGYRMKLEAPRKWVEIILVRDWGVPLYIVGAVMLIISMAFVGVGRLKKLRLEASGDS